MSLLCLATWKESKIIWKGKQRTLAPGSVVIGITTLSESLGCTRPTLYRWLNYLQSSGRIVVEKDTRGTLVTILNWDTYQGLDEGPLQSIDSDFTPTIHTPLQRVYTDDPLIEEDKKVRKKEIHTVERKRPTRHAVKSTFDLESAYQTYPLKEGKTPGLKILAREIQTQDDYDALLRAILKYSRSERVKRGFILNFKTFAGQWRDWAAEDVGTASTEANERLERKRQEAEQARIDAEHKRKQEEYERRVMAELYGEGAK